MLGDYEAARDVYSKWLESETPDWRHEVPLFRSLVQYLSGEEDEAALLRRCDSLKRLSMVHYCLGLRWLAPDIRDRDRAKEHFEKYVDLGVFSFWVIYRATGFLGQMEQDPSRPQYADSDGEQTEVED